MIIKDKGKRPARQQLGSLGIKSRGVLFPLLAPLHRLGSQISAR